MAAGVVSVAVGVGLTVACGCTKIWICVPLGSTVFAPGFWLYTVPGWTDLIGRGRGGDHVDAEPVLLRIAVASSAV